MFFVRKANRQLYNSWSGETYQPVVLLHWQFQQMIIHMITVVGEVIQTLDIKRQFV